MGSRGSNSGAGGGSDEGVNVISSKSLISEREGYQTQVDSMFEVLRDIENQYGAVVDDLVVSKIKDRGRGITLGYSDGENIGINEKLFYNTGDLEKNYEGNGYHPSVGDKTVLQAVTAHEFGHRLNYIAGGNSWGNMDKVAENIVKNASRATGYKNKTAQFRQSISGYANTNNAEAVAESFADVYCNGDNAKAGSKAVVNELNKYFGR